MKKWIFILPFFVIIILSLNIRAEINVGSSKNSLPAVIIGKNQCPLGEFVYGFNSDGSLRCAFPNATSPGNATDEKVKIYANDSVSSYLGYKLVAGFGINFNIINDMIYGEQIEINSTGGITNETDPLWTLNLTNGVTGNLIPYSDITYQIGNSTNRWNSAWAINGSFQHITPITTGKIDVLGSVYPTTDNTYDLGYFVAEPDTYWRWKNLYLAGDLNDGTGNSCSIAQACNVSSGVISHHDLSNLTDGDDHPQYAYLNGRDPGQTLYGGASTGLGKFLTLFGAKDSIYDAGIGLYDGNSNSGGPILVYAGDNSKVGGYIQIIGGDGNNTGGYVLLQPGTNNLSVVNDIIISGNGNATRIRPDTTNNVDSGTPTYQWNDTYTKCLTLNGSKICNWSEINQSLTNYWNRTGINLYPSNLSDNVGIGTDSPETILHLYSFSGPNIRFTDNVSGIQSYDVGSDGFGGWRIYDKTNGRMKIQIENPALNDILWWGTLSPNDDGTQDLGALHHHINKTWTNYITDGITTCTTADACNTSYVPITSNSTLARIGTAQCTSGQYVSNVTTTTSGVSLVCSTPPSSGGQWTNDSNYIYPASGYPTKINVSAILTPVINSTTNLSIYVNSSEKQHIYGSGIVTFNNQSRSRDFIRADQTIISAAKVQFNSENWDEQNEFNTSSYQFVAKEAGYYQVNYHAQWHNIGIGGQTLSIFIQANSITTSRSDMDVDPTAVHWDNDEQILSDVLQLNAGDKVDFWAEDTGSQADLKAGTEYTYVSIHKLS